MSTVYDRMRVPVERVEPIKPPDTTPVSVQAWNKFVRSLSVAKESFEEYTKAIKGGEMPQELESFEQQRLDIFSIYDFEKALPLIISHWSTNGGLDEMIIKMKGKQNATRKDS